MDYVKAFIVGGLICAAVQILLDRTKLMPGRVMVLLVCGGALLGFCGLYDPFQKLAGAGAGVPLPGFGNVLWQGVKEAVDKYGFCVDSLDNLPDLFAIAGQMLYFCNF